MAQQTFDLYQRVAKLPAGKRIFSLLYSVKAPYFATVRPLVREVRPNYAELSIRNRKRVHNHIGTLHAIAVCNGLEAAMGLVAEATCPADKRWLPRGLQVSYLAKSTTDLLCIAETDPAQWAATPGDVDIKVKAVRTDGVVVVEGVIPVYVTEKPKKA
ncbi:thioesterase [Janibacter sp. Soil728]|uniref:hotdog fold domain-containing protein n=1 Tax=Janibacter sp. Soil728 TaxID=1736393 RepID=UPI0006F4DB55|nr:hotdog fold domain-containing protein [Janibacter sp. Soil728]KRE37928.1 thioesterase [Janibacter sp. Soil728]